MYIHIYTYQIYMDYIYIHVKIHGIFLIYTGPQHAGGSAPAGACDWRIWQNWLPHFYGDYVPLFHPCLFFWIFEFPHLDHDRLHSKNSKEMALEWRDEGYPLSVQNSYYGSAPSWSAVCSPCPKLTLGQTMYHLCLFLSAPSPWSQGCEIVRDQGRKFGNQKEFPWS